MDLRLQFPVLKRIVYLNTAGYGLVPLVSVKRVTKILRELCEKGARDSGYEEKVLEDARVEVRRLINCDPSEVFFTVSTTTGLREILGMLRLEKRDAVVSFDLEFPGVASVVKTFCSRVGCELRVIRHRGGIYDVGDIEKAVGDNTRVIVASSVQWVNGFLMPLRELREIADSVGAYLVLDVIQHAGAVKLDVKEVGADFVVAGGEKWLLSTWFGVGFVYVRRGILDELDAPPLGLHNMKEPSVKWSYYWFDPSKDCWSLLEPKKTAARLEWAGTPPLLGVVGFRESLAFLNEVGMERVHEHNIRLKELVVDSVFERGWEVVSFTEDRERWSSITTFKIPGLSMEDHFRLVNMLKEEGVIAAARGAGGLGGIRVSPHLYNTEEDLEKLFSGINRLLTSL
ncbi:MAG: hypothetical protein DRJ52_10670 [Thermoprotei archaeon]|nr:MAG: hypothetical protein DRJ52_10670 [Thermoprotei archaeon]RLE99374.1 MAG: hypothetical protein DRJ63_05530 [Thermoprotei archaeon]HDI75199.1 aminotransferase class V-fold PLP-dependent enzyme [Thermoprotei archaeon]